MNTLIRIVVIAAAVGASGLTHATFIGTVPNPGGVLMPVSGENSYAVRDRGAFSSNHSRVYNTASSAPGKAFSDFYLAGPGKLDSRFSSVTPAGAAAGLVTNLREANQVPFYNYSIFQGRLDHSFLGQDDNNRVDDDHGDMLVMMKAFDVPVPEPGTLALFGIGLVALICARKSPFKRKVTFEN
ncbi:PEP-CTERM sorting domain-containing protein [Marinobacter sp. F4216]|uniref:PEP-CTERM sorting domain-containing protein n=1 Tax=Marinobacter sp. F4216 TaxID=2874281 RepID=UPI001CBB3C70|nr:PEP-CTERM sorting domain-containing protein [Marinobacter sp. F4216]MBZ2168115.1 PEP-CTERM sorting domain-containing protein [Marinobacter sp. F4216]